MPPTTDISDIIASPLRHFVKVVLTNASVGYNASEGLAFPAYAASSPIRWETTVVTPSPRMVMP